MVAGRYLTAPIVVFSLSGEMIYILAQRLKAQGIPLDKSARVLNEIAHAIYNSQFIDQLFLNQNPLSFQFLKQLFQRLAHSSIMKLNEVSMSKLFDLMIMSIKLQYFLTSSPFQIYQVAMNHLKQSLQLMDNGKAMTQISNTIKKFKTKYQSLSFSKYFQIKQELLKFLQQKNIRVSIFLQEYFQHDDGPLIHYNRYGPHMVNPIGTIINENQSQAKINIGLHYKNFKKFKKSNFTEWNSQLGLNIYQGIKPFKQINEQSIKSTTTSVANKSSKFQSNNANQIDNSLSDLILGANKNSNSDFEFTLDLFGDSSKVKGKYEIDVSTVYQKPKQNNLKKKIQKQFEQLEKKKPNQNQEQEDDLLDMLDKAM